MRSGAIQEAYTHIMSISPSVNSSALTGSVQAGKVIDTKLAMQNIHSSSDGPNFEVFQNQSLKFFNGQSQSDGWTT